MKIWSKTRNIASKFSSYPRFFVSGSIVGLICIALREVATMVFRLEGPLAYGMSVLVIYIIGMLSSFLLQKKFVFFVSNTYSMRRKIFIFIAINIFSAISVSSLSTWILYGFMLERYIEVFAPAIAMALAMFLFSFVSYYLITKFVFNPKNGY